MNKENKKFLILDIISLGSCALAALPLGITSFSKFELIFKIVLLVVALVLSAIVKIRNYKFHKIDEKAFSLPAHLPLYAIILTVLFNLFTVVVRMTVEVNLVARLFKIVALLLLMGLVFVLIYECSNFASRRSKKQHVFHDVCLHVVLGVLFFGFFKKVSGGLTYGYQSFFFNAVSWIFVGLATTYLIFLIIRTINANRFVELHEQEKSGKDWLQFLQRVALACEQDVHNLYDDLTTKEIVEKVTELRAKIEKEGLDEETEERIAILLGEKVVEVPKQEEVKPEPVKEEIKPEPKKEVKKKEAPKKTKKASNKLEKNPFEKKTKKEEPKPVEKKPVEEKPVEKKPVEKKPVEKKPVEVVVAPTPAPAPVVKPKKPTTPKKLLDPTYKEYVQIVSELPDVKVQKISAKEHKFFIGEDQFLHTKSITPRKYEITFKCKKSTGSKLMKSNPKEYTPSILTKDKNWFNFEFVGDFDREYVVSIAERAIEFVTNK